MSTTSLCFYLGIGAPPPGMAPGMQSGYGAPPPSQTYGVPGGYPTPPVSQHQQPPQQTYGMQQQGGYGQIPRMCTITLNNFDSNLNQTFKHSVFLWNVN
jgi:hypothetical protein